MATTRTLEAKVGDWSRAYDAIRRELVPEELRLLLDTMKGVEGYAQFKSYVDLVRTVMASDRAAGTIAALLTANGVKPTTVGDYGDESD